MKLFISQSKPRSLALAQTYKSFIRKVIPGIDPWVSDPDIEKGARFMTAIKENLDTAVGGMVCLTSENLSERWILFEAGALSTKVTDRVWTLLLDVDHTAVLPPLDQFNHTKAEKADVLKMVKSMHKAAVTAKATGSSEADVESYFNAFWDVNWGPRSPNSEHKVLLNRSHLPAFRTKP
jgi:hypothetical protein